MILFTILFALINLVVIYYLVQPAVLRLLAKNKKVSSRPATGADRDFAIMLPVYKDPSLIPFLVDSLLKQSYKNFHVYVIADECPLNGPRIKHEKVSWLIPSAPLRSKIKSIELGIENMERQHDVLLIFDNDNVVDPKFLENMNDSFKRGYKVVQGLVKAKNQENNIARMDEAGFQFYHAIDRKYRKALGLSAHINGLGIGIDMQLYRDITYRSHVGGFDKKLQAEMVILEQIDFREDAIVYDEKVSDEKQLQSQRTRWTFTYFHYFGNSLKVMKKGLMALDIDRIVFGLNLLRLPLFLLVSLAGLLTLSNLLLGNYIMALTTITAMITFAWSFVTIIRENANNPELVKSLRSLPVFIKNQFIGLLNIRKAQKSFMVTQHNAQSKIEDVLQKAA